MGFESVVGQKRVKALLSSAIAKERLPHAVLFTGPPGIGKDAMALAASLTLVCAKKAEGGCGECPACTRAARLENPSFVLVHPVPSRPAKMKMEKYVETVRERLLARLADPYKPVSFAPELATAPYIGIDEIRELRQEARLMLAGGGTRVFCVLQAECMTLEAANSLLKLLEEPPEDTVFLLTTASPGDLPQTVLSRCQRMELDMLSEEDIARALVGRRKVPEGQSRFIARMSGGSLARGLSLADGDFDWKRECAWQLLDVMTAEQAADRLDGADALMKQVGKLEIADVLQVLLALLRDLRWVRLGREDRLADAGNADRLRAFAAKHPEVDPDRASDVVLRAIDFAGKNVYLALNLHALDWRAAV